MILCCVIYGLYSQYAANKRFVETCQFKYQYRLLYNKDALCCNHPLRVCVS